MSNLARVFLNPSSHSINQSRFIIPSRGHLIGSSLHLELDYDSQNNGYFLPRCGAYNLIDSISILRDGEEISYTSGVGPWMSLKLLSVTDIDTQRKIEAKTGGALFVDISESMSPYGGGAVATNSVNASWIHSPIYALNSINQTVDDVKPFLQMSLVCDLFAKNLMIDTEAHKYEILINWIPEPGQIYPCVTPSPAGSLASYALTMKPTTQMVYVTATNPKIPRNKLTNWMEQRFTMFQIPEIASGSSDSNTLAIRFTNCKASAIFIGFVPIDPIKDQLNSCSVAWGNTFSHPASWAASNEVNLIVNGRSILPRPIGNESQRIEHLNRALQIGCGGNGTSCAAYGLNTYTTNEAGAANVANSGDLGAFSRGASYLMALGSVEAVGPPVVYATKITSTNYYGFNLSENGEPIDLDSSGIYLVLNRGLQPVGLNIPALAGYAYLVGPRY